MRRYERPHPQQQEHECLLERRAAAAVDEEEVLSLDWQAPTLQPKPQYHHPPIASPQQSKSNTSLTPQDQERQPSNTCLGVHDKKDKPKTKDCDVDFEIMMTAAPSTSGVERNSMIRSSQDSGPVGIAYSTQEQQAMAFDQQYREEQAAYQRAMEEEQARQRQEKVIKTLDRPQPSSTTTPFNQSTVTLGPPPESQQPVQNRVFGLRKDLAGVSVETAHLDATERNRPKVKSESAAADMSANPFSSPAPSSGTSSPNKPVTQAGSSDGPQFSVEVIAPAFDKRGYPVFSGRGARIRGILRTQPVQNCEVVIRLTAVISQGSPAAVFDGVALMPPEQGNERKVFTVEDRIVLNDSMATLRPGANPASTKAEDCIFSVPFSLNLPLGVSTRFVNGEATTTAVALPPSYEMSSENDAKERDSTKANNVLRSSAASIKSRSSRMTNFSTVVGSSVKDAMEKGLGEVYRIGCFYKLGFSLQKLPVAEAEPVKKRLGKKKKNKDVVEELDNITVPFIFMGEPTHLPPPPHSIPLSLVAPVLLNAGTNLGKEWECERAQAKWNGNFFRTAKRTVDLEMHMPAPAVLQAPCVFPLFLIIRPADPALLSSISSASLMLDTDTIQAGTQHSPHTSVTKAPHRSSTSHEISQSSDDTSTQLHNDGFLSRFKSSLSLSRRPSTNELNSSSSMSTITAVNESSSNSIRNSLSSGFSRRRPNTAPSGASSGESRSGTLVLGSGGQYQGNLSGLVKVSLLQTTYCVSSGPSDTPKSRRKLISEAEVEEVPIEALLSETEIGAAAASTSGDGSQGDLAALEANQALASHVQSKGIRVLRCLIRVGTDLTPSFRCQGIEVKYAIKVDLIPFSKKDGKRPASGGSSGGSTTTPGRRSINIPSSPSLSNPSPPVPPFPAEHRRGGPQTSPSKDSPTSTVHQPHYTPSVVAGLGGVGGTSTIVSESSLNPRLDKGIGALWADVRVVRGVFAG